MASSPQFSWNWQPSQDHSMPAALGFLPHSSPLLDNSPTLGSPSQRKREDESSQSPLLGIKKNKMKGKISSPVTTPRTFRKMEDEKMAKRIRESYACLRHRAMHKRCPAECPERRIPKPLPVAQERWQVQQVSQHNRPKSIQESNSSPIMSSPNTLRVLQDFQNAHISSPQLQRRESIDSQDSLKGELPSLWDNGSASSNNNWLTDETWNDISNTGNRAWDSSESHDDSSSPLNDLDSWFVDGTPGPLTGFTDEELSAVAQSIDSTHQLLNDYSPDNHMSESPIELLLRITLSRDHIERWIDDELFLKSLRGFYVRVRIAEVNGILVHRIGCIVEVRDNCFKTSTYNECHKGIVVHFGSTGQHIVALGSISNSPPDESECNDWATDAERNHITIMPEEVQEKEQILRILQGKNAVVYSSH